MEYVIVAFRSRTQTLEFHKLLRINFISSEIVNTPKEAGVGCGLSVKIEKGSFAYAKMMVNRFRASSFAGFFLVSSVGGRKRVRAI